MSAEKQEKKHILSLFGKKPFLFLLLLIGALLLFFGGGAFSQPTATVGQIYDADGAKEALRLEATRLAVTASGDSGAVVFLYFEGNERYVYAANETSSGGYSYLYSGGSGLLLTVEGPPVSGVAVLCRGGGQIQVREELKGLFSSLFGVGYDRIEIAERKP